MNGKQLNAGTGLLDKQSSEEDMPVIPSAEIQEKCKQLDIIYEQFFEEDNNLHIAKHSSKEERDKKGLNDSSFVYGEVTFRSVAYIFEYLKYHYGKEILPGNFYDMGSGVGKGILAAAFLYPFTKCIGIEYLENLHNIGLETKKKFELKFEEVFKLNQEYFPNYTSIPELELINGDFLKQSWSNASIILANSTCFSAKLMSSLAAKAESELEAGSIFITFTKRLPNLSDKWEIKEGFRRLMSWGIATVYVHRKKISTEE